LHLLGKFQGHGLSRTKVIGHWSKPPTHIFVKFYLVWTKTSDWNDTEHWNLAKPCKN